MSNRNLNSRALLTQTAPSRALLFGLATALLSCNSTDSPTSRPQPLPIVTELPPTPAMPTFPAGTQSLELTRTVGVRLQPGEASQRIGAVAVNTRVGWTRFAVAAGCRQAWVEMAPRGWICSDYVRPSSKPPYGDEVPQLDRGEIVPGIYGKITAPIAFMYNAEGVGQRLHMRRRDRIIGSLNVRKYDEVSVDGATYWKVAQRGNQYVLASAITKHVASPYIGGRLGDDIGWNLPIAFVWPRAGMQRASITATQTGGTAIRQPARRTFLPVLDSISEATMPPVFRVGDSEWISASDARIFRAVPPPASLRQGERWIDVDLDTQILVAFEGDQPVYATMISSGGKATPTETGLFRIWLKESEADMKGLNGEDPYSVATVPWAQFFSPIKGLALHAAYWHDRFGNQLSHGCVNLAPRDARRLYYWSEPQVPPGWTSTTGVVEAPGSLIRIRSSADPTPEFKGYAKQVAELRAR